MLAPNIKLLSIYERHGMTEEEEQCAVTELDEALLIARLEEWLQK